MLWSVSRPTRQRQHQREGAACIDVLGCLGPDASPKYRVPAWGAGVLTSPAAGPTSNCKRGPARQAESAVATCGAACTCTCTSTCTSTASQPRCTRARASLRLRPRPHTQQGAHISLPDGHVKTTISSPTCPDDHASPMMRAGPEPNSALASVAHVICKTTYIFTRVRAKRHMGRRTWPAGLGRLPPPPELGKSRVEICPRGSRPWHPSP